MQKTLCKKCGGFHIIDSYKTLRFYSCPVVNRVLLLSDEVKEVDDGYVSDTGSECSGVGTDKGDS